MAIPNRGTTTTRATADATDLPPIPTPSNPEMVRWWTDCRNVIRRIVESIKHDASAGKVSIDTRLAAIEARLKAIEDQLSP